MEETQYRILPPQISCENPFATEKEITEGLFWSFAKDKLPPKYRFVKFTDVTDYIMVQVRREVELWGYNIPATVSIISNQNGIGKTHLAICCFKKFLWDQISKLVKKQIENYKDLIDYSNLHKKIPAIKFITENDLLSEIKTTFQKDSKITENEILTEYRNLSFLVIDDIFATNNKDFEFSRRILLDIIDRRDLFNRPTFITSNLTLKEIQNIDSRIADRINNSMLFEINTKIESFRKQNS